MIIAVDTNVLVRYLTNDEPDQARKAMDLQWSIVMRITSLQAILLLGAIGLSGCSGPQQDVRVSFCKDLVAVHLDALKTIWWLGDSSEIKRPEYATIKLSFKIGDQSTEAVPRQASCSYEYDTTDENVMTHADPLSAYATVPYRMIVDGEAVAEPVLKQLIPDVGLLQADEFLGRLRKWLAETLQQISQSLM